LISVVVAPLL
jgi:hypothetical protein